MTKEPSLQNVHSETRYFDKVARGPLFLAHPEDLVPTSAPDQHGAVQHLWHWLTGCTIAVCRTCVEPHVGGEPRTTETTPRTALQPRTRESSSPPRWITELPAQHHLPPAKWTCKFHS